MPAARAGGSARAPCPVSMSCALADAFAERERALVDHLTDDPPQHQPRRVADPRDVLAERREEALRALRPPPARSSRCASARPAAPARAGRARGSRPRSRRGSSAPSEPARQSISARRPAGRAARVARAAPPRRRRRRRRAPAGGRTRPSAPAARRRVGVVRRAHLIARLARRARAARPASTPAPAITTTPSPWPGASRRQRLGVLRPR